MAKLPISDGQFAQTFTVNTKTGSYIILSTANTYVNKNIKITTNVKSAVAVADTATADTTLYTIDGANAGVNIGNVTNVVGTKTTTEPSSGYYLAVTASATGNSKITTAGWIDTGSLGAASASEIQYYPIQAGAYSTSGGGLTANTGYANITTNACYTNGSYDTSDSVDVASQSSDTEGYYKITVEGYGNVKRAAIKKTASTAGYIPINTSGTQTSAATNKNSKKGYAYLYIKKSTITDNSITPSTSAQTVTISDGYYPIARTVSIAAMTTTTVTTSYSNTGMSTYFDSHGSASGASVTITPQYTNTDAGYLVAHTTATPAGGVGYWKIKTSTTNYGVTTISGTEPNQTATRGIYTWTTGWITAGSMPTASFANEGTNGVEYADITNTTEAPVLSSADGYLYINQGYTDNLKIHIGKFISPEVTIQRTDQILASYTAYDANGNLLTGTIPSKNSTHITRSGNTITIPWGKYEGIVGQHDAVTYTITAGDYTTTATNTIAGTITPKVAINNASTYGFTTTQPSGTNGTNYLTLDPGADVTTQWKATATATITTEGYLATGSKTATVKGSPTIAAGTNYYVPVITPTFTAGTITASISDNTINTTMTTTETATSYYIDAAAEGSASCTAPTWTSTSKGVISVTAGTSAGTTPTALNNLTKSATRVYIPAATGSITMTAGNGSCTYNSTDSANITLSTTDTSGVKISFDGSGEVSAVATTTAGYTPANNSYATGTSTSSGTQTTTRYVTGVTIVPPDNLEDNAREFSITVPNGSRSDFITFVFTVAYDGSVTVAGPD